MESRKPEMSSTAAGEFKPVGRLPKTLLVTSWKAGLLALGICSLTACGNSSGGNEISNGPGTNLQSKNPASLAILEWDPNSESDLAGYNVYISTTQGIYGSPYSSIQKSENSYAVPSQFAKGTYFFSVTAYDNSGLESPPSNEVSLLVP